MLFKQFFRSYIKILIITVFGYAIILLGLFILSLQLNQEVDEFTVQTHKFYQHPFKVNAAAQVAKLSLQNVKNLQNEMFYMSTDKSQMKQTMIVADIKKNLLRLAESLSVIEANFSGDMDKVREIAELAILLEKKHREIIKHTNNVDIAKAYHVIAVEINPLYKKMLQGIEYVVDFSDAKAMSLVSLGAESGLDSQKELRTLLIIFALFTLFSGVITATIIIRLVFLKDERLRKINDKLRISATAFETQEGVMVTDADLSILQVNQAFTSITGYEKNEVIGYPPNILSSGKHNKVFYEAMWQDINQKGSWEGEIWNARKSGELYPQKLTITSVKNVDAVVINYVGTLNDITEAKKSEKKIEDLAYYDPLTRLPNRRLMLDRLSHALAAHTRKGHGGALLFLDIDHFKTLNDTLGHDIGDQLLMQIAKRLGKCVRVSDTVSRFGGDEFVVLIEGLNGEAMQAAAQTKNVAYKILQCISAPYKLNSHHYMTTASIGITLFNDHHKEVEDLLKEADIALYQAKDDGRNTLCFFDPKMQLDISKRAELEVELKQAIDQQQFQLYYQMQMDSEQRPVGAEALIRWINPVRGLIPPIDFIPLAEQNGSIVAIGKWVLETACAQLKIWENNAATCQLTLSVNVSARQFHQPEFVDTVTSVILRHDIDPSKLKLELTESLLLGDIKATIAKMEQLSKSGIQFSLDDFGTGYSSLQYLKKLPLYQLKIDKSFIDELVSNNSDQAIVRTIIAMADSLGLNVIAEGVETKEQQEILRSEGCFYYQGYLLGKPVTLTEYESSLNESYQLQ